MANLTLFNSNPSPKREYSFLLAITALALAAKIHNTDQAVRLTGFHVLKGIDTRHHEALLTIINSPAPLAHINMYVASIPDRILTMKPAAPRQVLMKKPA